MVGSDRELAGVRAAPVASIFVPVGALGSDDRGQLFVSVFRCDDMPTVVGLAADPSAFECRRELAWIPSGAGVSLLAEATVEALLGVGVEEPDLGDFGFRQAF
jgi:hypothetical protein